ncbi:hypothetical protein LA361_15395 [Clostridioides difficile]|nr:hypothetical protein [Clostridioides difficile]MCA5555488.1 hypothetical protein [Clostridioides difficile]
MGNNMYGENREDTSVYVAKLLDEEENIIEYGTYILYLKMNVESLKDLKRYTNKEHILKMR